MIRTLTAHLRAQWMGALALLLVLTGGVAYAANTISSTDIVNGQVKSPDIGTGQVQSIDVKNDGLTGADIAESSLGEVPSAALGGLGGDTPPALPCDPEGSAFVTCAQTGTITLAAPTRILIIGQIRGLPEDTGGNAGGTCHVGTNAGFLPESAAFVDVEGASESVTVSGVTGVLGAGPIALGLDCDEGSGGITYSGAHLTYVQLSPG